MKRLIVIALIASGCGAAHLTPYYGESYTRTFARQVLYPDALRDPNKLMGLDSSEASIVSRSYLKRLAPISLPSESGDSLLYVSPTPGAAAGTGRGL